MTSPDEQPLPLDPGPVPASLRDAYTAAEASRRVAAPTSHPSDLDVESLLDDTLDDQARLTIVDQLLASRQGIETLAYLVAARGSTAETPAAADGDSLPASTVPLPFVSPAAARHRRVTSTIKPLLLAASLMMVAGTSWYVFTLPPRDDDVRALGSAIELVSVPQSSAASAITLTWKRLNTTARYRVEVLDANDDPVFTVETNDTSAVVPRASLKPGTYRWWVRSRAADGAEIRSRVEKLIVH